MSFPDNSNPHYSITDGMSAHGAARPDDPNLASNWTTLADKVIGTPVVLSRGNRLDVFYQQAGKNSNDIYHNWRVDGSDFLPKGELRVTSTGLGFSAVSREQGSYDIVGIGPLSNSLWHVTCDNGVWKEKRQIDKPDNINVAGKPIVISWGSDRRDLFIVMANKRPYWAYKTKHKDNFEPFVWIGGEIIGLPGVACWGPNRIDISVHGPDNQVYHKTYYKGTWYPTLDSWGPLRGVVRGNLTEISARVGLLAVYSIGATAPHAIFTKTFGEGEWHPRDGSWISLGGECIDDTISAVSGVASQLDLAIRRSDGTVCHKFWNGAAWEPSQTDWNYLDGNLKSPPVLSPVGSLKLETFGTWSDDTLRYCSE